MKAEILGTGCPRCKKTEELVKRALSELDAAAEVEHITDPTAFAAYGVIMTLGLVVDGEVKPSGKVPSQDELKRTLEAAKLDSV